MCFKCKNCSKYEIFFSSVEKICAKCELELSKLYDNKSVQIIIKEIEAQLIIEFKRVLLNDGSLNAILPDMERFALSLINKM